MQCQATAMRTSIQLAVFLSVAALITLTLALYYTSVEDGLHTIRVPSSKVPTSFSFEFWTQKTELQNLSLTSTKSTLASTLERQQGTAQPLNSNATMMVNVASNMHIQEDSSSTASMPPLTLKEYRGNTTQQLQAHSHGYVLTLTYTGQQSAGLRGIMSQQCWVAAFNLPLKIVEPFGINSSLCHRAKAWTSVETGEGQTRFSDYFDIEHFNQHARAAKNPLLVPWQEFLLNAPRQVIVVYIGGIHARNCMNYGPNSCQYWRQNQKAINTFTSNCTADQSMDEAVKYLQLREFEIVRTVCFKCGIWSKASPQLLPSGITQHIFGQYKPSKVTLIFDVWKFSLKITPRCRESPKCHTNDKALTQWTQPSPQLSINADHYIQSSLKTTGHKTVAIMIRVEWYTIYMRKNIRFGVCLKQLEDKLRSLRKNRKNLDKHAPPILAMDVGKYGSGSWSSTLRIHSLTNKYLNFILESMQSFVPRIYNKTWTFKDWENSFSMAAEAYPDRGYIAALQSTIASKADCLVLMGGGHFQELALKMYKRTHSKYSQQCVHFICMANLWKKHFSWAINH